MTIKVEIKTVYGVDKIYPVCDKATLFARLAGQCTLTKRNINDIKELGYTVEVVSNKPSTL